jgi:hypothetical protein
MTMTEETTLRDHEDTEDLPDGRTLRLLVEGTDVPAMDQINGCDTYGRVAWPVRNRYPEMHNGAPDHRPDDFDGAARKLYPNGWHTQGTVWWQPHPTTVAAGPEALEREAEEMTRLLGDGFVYVVLELLDGTDAYGHPIVVDAESLAGVDRATDDYLAEIVEELRAELLGRPTEGE